MDQRAFDGGPGPARAHRLGRAALLPRRPLQGRHRRRVPAQPVQGRPADRVGAHQRPGAHRDRLRRVPSTSTCPAGCRRRSGCATRSSSTPPRTTPPRCASTSGAAAADLLTEIVTAEDVLGLAWARAVSAMTGLADPARRHAGRPADRRARPHGRRRQLDRAGARGARGSPGGPAYLFYAPLIVPDAATARAPAPAARGRARRSPTSARSPRRSWGSASWEAGQSTLYDAMQRGGARGAAAERGVIADVSGVFVDADGHAGRGAAHRPDDRHRRGARCSAIPEVIAHRLRPGQGARSAGGRARRSGQRPGHPLVPGPDAARRRMSPGVAGTRVDPAGRAVPTERHQEVELTGGTANRGLVVPGRRHGAPPVAPDHAGHPRAAAAPGGGRVRRRAKAARRRRPGPRGAQLRPGRRPSRRRTRRGRSPTPALDSVGAAAAPLPRRGRVVRREPATPWQLPVPARFTDRAGAATTTPTWTTSCSATAWRSR